MISLDPNLQYLVGVSGGVDSMVLFHLMVEQGYSFAVANIDHQLRDESASESVAVEEMCKTHNIKFYGCSINVNEISNGRSVEDTARRLRREFFNSIPGYDRIVLAHHADDQAETVFNNFIRGSSVHGLGGMLADDGHYVRPLLDMTKQEIIEYATINHITWFEDHTNHETDYDRCWIRNTVFPELETRRPVAKVLAAKARHFQLMSDYMTSQANAVIDAGLTRNSYNALHEVIKGEVLGQLWVRLHGTKKGFCEAVAERGIAWLASKSFHNGTQMPFGKYVLVAHKINKDYEIIIVSK